MSETAIKTYADFVLPGNVVTQIDVSRLVREMERVDNELTASSVRKKAGVAEAAKPALSSQLADFLAQNKLSIEGSRERDNLIKQVRLLKDKVPVIHMTFAVTADGESLEKLVAWVRGTVHPQAVIEIGLQPDLIAGVYIRTPNHVHDFSWRALLKGKHDLLVKELEALRGGK